MILIKQSSSYQISYLYNLLYCRSIDEFFRSKGMFRFVDYSISSTTYYKGGVIAIRVNLVTEQARKHAGKMKSLDIATDNDSVGIRIPGMILEQKRGLAMPGIDEVQLAIKDIHDRPWQDIDDIDIIDTRGADTKGGVLTLTNDKLSRPRNLIADISLHPDAVSGHPELLPLFTDIAYLVYENSLPEISAVYGMNPEGTKGGQYKHGFTMPFTFKVHPSPLIHDATDSRDTITEILFVFLDCIEDLHRTEAFNRYINDLQQATYTTPFYPASGPILNDTGFFVGAKGWQRIATKENCMLLLDNMTIKVRYGKQRQSFQVAELLKDM